MGVKYKKDKGNYLENKVAEAFRKHHNLEKHDVHRAQSSGNFSTEFGDIYFRSYRLIIECKNHSDINFSNLFPIVRKNILKFYSQLQKDIDDFVKQYSNQNFDSFLVVADSSKRFGPYVVKKISEDYVLPTEISYIITHSPDNEKFIVEELDQYVKNLNLEDFRY